MNAERWMSIPGYEGTYEVSDLGNVRSLTCVNGARRHPRPVNARLDLQGRPMVNLGSGSARTTRRVHVLVALAFLGPRQDGMEICHLNDEKQDNRLANLRYDTRAGNEADKKRNGRTLKGRYNPVCKNGHRKGAPGECGICASERYGRMYAVLVTDKQGGTVAYGPYRSQPKADALAALFRNPFAADFLDPEEYDVTVAPLRKYND